MRPTSAAAAILAPLSAAFDAAPLHADPIEVGGDRAIEARHPSQIELPDIAIDQFELRTAGSLVELGWDVTARLSFFDQDFRIESAGQGECGQVIETAEGTALWACKSEIIPLVLEFVTTFGRPRPI